MWREESYTYKFVDLTVAWGDWPSAQWVETDPLSVVTPGTLIIFSNSDDFVCLSCSKKLSTTCASSSRTLQILREYLRLCRSFRWVWLNGGEIQICVCVCASIFIPLQVADYSCLSLAGPSGWVLQRCGMGGIRSLVELRIGDGFFHLPSIQRTGSCVNLNPARTLHEPEVFGSHRVPRTRTAFCVVLCSVLPS